MKKLSPSTFNTSKWSGGETTELVIYPAESNFKERNFDYRLSIATIKVSSSDFTPLPGINRTLLLLEGELKLIHEDHHQSFLMPFSQDSFKGDWNTHSIGIAKDFNLMTKGDVRGVIHVISNDFMFDSKADHVICYNHDADAKIAGQEILLAEVIVITDVLNPIDIEVDGKLIVVEIFLS